jgi:hypothetical protein
MSPTPNPAQLRPRIVPPDTPFLELRAKTPYFHARLFGKSHFDSIYGKRSIFRDAVKTIMVNILWRNSGCDGVQQGSNEKKGCFEISDLTEREYLTGEDSRLRLERI